MSEGKVSIDDEILAAEQELRNSDTELQKEHAICPFSGATKQKSVEGENTTEGALPYQYIPLRMGGRGGTHMTSEGSMALIKNEVSLADLKKMTGAFYQLAFQDETLDKFIRSHSDPHGDRFAKWIHQKLSGSNVWDKDRKHRDLTPVSVAGGRTAVVHDRSSAHAAAWFSPKRPKKEVGRRFQLDECRVWMRLHFYAMRQAGIVEKSPSFADYYVRFIGHFISVYEGTATMFARDSFRWSAKQTNIDRYIKNGRAMNDVLGLNYRQSIKSLPENELEDDDWPYFKAQ